MCYQFLPISDRTYSIAEMRGYVSADRYFANIRNSLGYGYDTDSNFLV